MKKELLYVELKQGHSGPAWIGYGQFSKSGNTVYFDGKVLKKGKGIVSNHYDIDTHEDYWISGVKKNGTDRHWAGSGKVFLDKTAVDDYLKLTGLTELPKNKFVLTEIDHIPNKDFANKIENAKLDEESFDRALMFKNPKDLNFEELKQVIKHYSELEPGDVHLKARKSYRDALNLVLEEMELRLASLNKV